jgi:hypothetical protein
MQNSEIYKPKLYHSILDISRDLNPSKAAMSIGIKIKLVTGKCFLENRKSALTLSSFDVKLTGRKLFFYCVIMLSTYVVKQSNMVSVIGASKQ